MMEADPKVELVPRIGEKIFAIAQVCRQRGERITVCLTFVGAQLLPPVRVELLLRMKLGIVQAPVRKKRIDRLDLMLFDQLSKQPVPDHDQIERRVMIKATAIQLAHNRAVVLECDLDVNSALALVVFD